MEQDMTKKDGERLSVLETEVKNVGTKINSIENSVQSLHGKFDSFMSTIADKYVPTSTFDEFKEAQKEKDRNRWLERVLTIMVTTAITVLVGLFFQGKL